MSNTKNTEQALRRCVQNWPRLRHCIDCTTQKSGFEVFKLLCQFDPDSVALRAARVAVLGNKHQAQNEEVRLLINT